MVKENEYKDFICYLNDDGSKVNAYVVIIKKAQSTINFLTKDGNNITIPWHRVLKVKQKAGDDND